MSISSQQVIGTAGATTGDIRTAETYPSDQYSQIEVTSTAAERRAVGRPGGADARRRAERLRRAVLLELRQPGADAVQAERGGWTQLGGTLQQRRAGGRDAAGAHRRSGSTIIVPGERGRSGSRSPTPASPAARRASWPSATPPPTTGPAAAVPAAAPRRTRSAGRYGLSGTVVLQDNGGDNLSVTANGSFTFTTQLASGARLQRDGADQPRPARPARSPTARAPSPRPTSPTSPSPARPSRRHRFGRLQPGGRQPGAELDGHV